MDQTAPTEPVFRLIYRSRDKIPTENRRAVLGDLFTDARANNKKQHITGALLLREGWFVQTLEGDEQAVQQLFDRIERDPRHTDIEVIDTGTVPSRVFARWAMARIGEEGGPAINVIAHADGIAPAMPRGPITPDQEGVLKVMSDAVVG